MSGKPYNYEGVRAYYKTESTFGTFNASNTAYSLQWTRIHPSLNPHNIKIRAGGNRNLVNIKRGMREGLISLAWNISNTVYGLFPGLYAGTARSIEVLYYTGLWGSPADLLSLLYTGCRATRFSFEGRASETDDTQALLRAAAEFVCQNLAINTSKQTSGTYEDNTSEGNKLFYDTYIKKAGAEIERCVGFKVEWNLHMKPIPVIRDTDGHLMKFLQITQRDCIVDLDFEFESKVEYDDVIGDTPRDWEIGLGATGYYVDLQDAKIELIGTPMNIGDTIFCKARLTPLSGEIIQP